MAEAHENRVGLRREISPLGFGAIALNGTIGAGIFALPAIAVESAGLFYVIKRREAANNP